MAAAGSGRRQRPEPATERQAPGGSGWAAVSQTRGADRLALLGAVGTPAGCCSGSRRSSGPHQETAASCAERPWRWRCGAVRSKARAIDERGQVARAIGAPLRRPPLFSSWEPCNLAQPPELLLARLGMQISLADLFQVSWSSGKLPAQRGKPRLPPAPVSACRRHVGGNRTMPARSQLLK